MREAIVVNPSSSWNKIYISLAQQVSTPPYYYLSSGLGGYIIYIKATKQVSTPEIYLDNIKLITQ